MRLTSRNIAVKVLNAKGCLSTLNTRLRQYMEEGDYENADCVREKALMLSAWIDALSRWNPTIESSYYRKFTLTYASGTFSFPFTIASSDINGIKFSNQINIYSGTVNEVLSKYKSAIDCYFSSNDDSLQVETKLSEETLTLYVYYSESGNIDYNDNGLRSNGVTFTTTSTGAPTEKNATDEPDCLTNDEVLSIVGKIDELCDNCNC